MLSNNIKKSVKLFFSITREVTLKFFPYSSSQYWTNTSVTLNKIEQNLMDKSKVRNSEMSMIKKYVFTMA